jgi:hypothetical protein
MRFVTPFAALLAALVLAACGGVAAPKPDPAGDAAFVTSLTQLCSKTPALVPLNATASVAAITSAAKTNWTTVNGLNAGLLRLTPSLSNATPLAPAITDLAQMLLDMMRRYKSITRAAARNDTTLVRSWVPLAIARGNQARSDLAKIGVASCLS